MADTRNWITKAREASGMTPIQAAAALNFRALYTWEQREQSPERLSLAELIVFYESVNDQSRVVIRDAIASFFDL